MRYDWLNQELFTDLDQVRQQAEDWLYHYNYERPNMDNGGFTPIQKLNHAAQFYLISVLWLGRLPTISRKNRQYCFINHFSH